MPSTAGTKSALVKFPSGMMGQSVVACLAVLIALSSRYRSSIINNEAFQVFLLSLASILAVAIAASILICLPDVLNGRKRSRRQGRRRESRHRSQRGSKSSKKKERVILKECSSNSSVLSHPSQSTHSTISMNSSTKKSPSTPPLTSQSRYNRFTNTKSTPSLVSASDDSTRRKPLQRQFNSTPSLHDSSASLQNLNPIAEHKREDRMDFADCYWRELDSRTQYYALIMGYTQSTWDRDFELDDLVCEDWDWDEMTKEQKAAATHFGYNRETWDDD